MTTALNLPNGEQLDVTPYLDEAGPKAHLLVSVRTPEGGAWYKNFWTAGGRELGDRIDEEAELLGFTFGDYIALCQRYGRDLSTENVVVIVHPLVPFAADVTTAFGDDGTYEDKVRAMAARLREQPGFEHVGQTLPWHGCGPTWLTI